MTPRKGFTLIELMITVAILGILAATAVPSFLLYLRRAKTNEAVTNLGTIARAQVQYWTTPRYDSTGQRLASAFVTAARLPAVPGKYPQDGGFTADPDWQTLGFAITDTVYYSYETFEIPATASDPAEAQCRATGDLNGDGVTSLFSLSVFAETQETARKAPYIYSVREYE